MFNDGYTITDGYLAENQTLEVVGYTKVIDVKDENYENVLEFKLYENNGFEKVAIRKGYYNGVDGYLMLKK